MRKDDGEGPIKPWPAGWGFTRLQACIALSCEFGTRRLPDLPEVDDFTLKGNGRNNGGPEPYMGPMGTHKNGFIQKGQKLKSSEMSEEYHVGDLSTLLQSATKSKQKKKGVNEKLQNLFSPSSQEHLHYVDTPMQYRVLFLGSENDTCRRKMVVVDNGQSPSTMKQKDAKDKKVFKKDKGAKKLELEYQKDGPQKRKLQVKQLIQEKEMVAEEGEKAKTRKKSPKKKKKLKSSQSPGFSPPAGIVHESLVTKPKQKAKKRKVESSSESEDETPSKKRKSEDHTNKKKMTRKRRDRMAQATDDRTIFVGNLPVTVKKKKLMNMLREYGTIESIRYRCLAPSDPNVPKRITAIKKNLHPERNNCVAYVCFESAASAKKAMKCNGRVLDGLHLRVDMAARDQVRDIKRSVFVGNLPFDIEEEAVRRHFEDCGVINNVRIIRDSKTSLGKGFCYVSFGDTDAVAFALRLNGSRFAGRQLRVMQCLPNPTKSVTDKQGSKIGKDRVPSKKGFKPSNDRPQPFHVIEAGKDWKKYSENENKEEPIKSKFQEKFEKVKQNRMEKGETYKQAQEKANKKLLKKMKLKSERKEHMKKNSSEPKNTERHNSKENTKISDAQNTSKFKSFQDTTQNAKSRPAKSSGRTFVKGKRIQFQASASGKSGVNTSRGNNSFNKTGFSAANRTQIHERKENVFANRKENSFSGAKHVKFDDTGKRSENKKTGSFDKTAFPRPSLMSGITDKKPTHIKFD